MSCVYPRLWFLEWQVGSAKPAFCSQYFMNRPKTDIGCSLCQALSIKGCLCSLGAACQTACIVCEFVHYDSLA
jgi:hypothetical protein